MIRCDPETLATTAPDVFLAGDVAYGPREPVSFGSFCTVVRFKRID